MTIAKKNLASINANAIKPQSSALWRAALRMEGLADAVTDIEIEATSRAASVISQEAIELQAEVTAARSRKSPLKPPHWESSRAAWAQLFPELEGVQGGVEGFAERILKAIWG